MIALIYIPCVLYFVFFPPEEFYKIKKWETPDVVMLAFTLLAGWVAAPMFAFIHLITNLSEKDKP